jgi:YqaJ-like viral recombinase domain
LEEDVESNVCPKANEIRGNFIGGSDARVIMGADGEALLRLWREKRGEAEPPDYSDNLIVQLGLATEPLNRRWYERTTGQAIKDVQSWIRHPVIRWMASWRIAARCSKRNLCCPWSFSEEAMWVTNATGAALSIITAAGKEDRPIF